MNAHNASHDSVDQDITFIIYSQTNVGAPAFLLGTTHTIRFLRYCNLHVRSLSNKQLSQICSFTVYQQFDQMCAKTVTYCFILILFGIGPQLHE
jgi:hypothetical protein